jgi:predicted Fe-S protein YdhL (DUF1289 family)
MPGPDLDPSAEPPADLALAVNEESLALQAATILVAERARFVWATGEFISPCSSVCRISDGLGLCVGCFRTRDEIARWSSAGDAEKRVVWRKIEHRMAAFSAGPAE